MGLTVIYQCYDNLSKLIYIDNHKTVKQEDDIKAIIKI